MGLHTHTLCVLFLSICVLLCAYVSVSIRATSRALPPSQDMDWLVTRPAQASALGPCRATRRWPKMSCIRLSNGLVSREFLLSPDFATIGFNQLLPNNNNKDVGVVPILRAIGPEAHITIDNIIYHVGGVLGQQTHAYMNYSRLPQLQADSSNCTFHYYSHTVGTPVAPYAWTPGTRFSPITSEWPPLGLRLDVLFVAPEGVAKKHALLTITIHYEIYDNIPVIAKWFTVSNPSSSVYVAPVVINAAVVELLGVARQFSPFQFSPYPPSTIEDWEGLLHVQLTQQHGSACVWQDSQYVSFTKGASEPVLNCSYTLGPAFMLFPDRSFDSFHVIEMAMDSLEAERRGLCRRRMMRVLAPQIQENPIFFHLTNTSSAGFRVAVDQMVEVGFEMIIFSFGSGFNLESNNATYIESIAADVAYAHKNNIQVGGYDLICVTRKVSAYWDVIDPDTHELGQSVCFASGWYDHLRSKIFNFLDNTGLDMLETDGPYYGTECASTLHLHHLGLKDSVQQQVANQNQLYKDLRGRNVFINAPDPSYFYNGINKAAMGYNEDQYSLPRWEDITVSRMGMYDDTYTKVPTMGWMFVPIVDYHGGGDSAAFEPMKNHSLEYEFALAQYLGSGVSAVYRGDILYDSNKTFNIVKKWVSFYKQYREIIISDIIHVERPSLQTFDCILHVNAHLKRVKALAMVFNPMLTQVNTTLTLPLYYSGLSGAVNVREEEGESVQYMCDREYNIDVPLNMKPQSITYFVIETL